MVNVPNSRKLRQALKASKWGYLEVSGGTLRTYDLFHAFRDAAKLYTPKGLISQSKVGFYNVPRAAKYNDADPFWDTEEALQIANELADFLDGISPDGYYFGASQGDGSAFGWWVEPFDGRPEK
jgi:hypothetical protein